MKWVWCLLGLGFVFIVFMTTCCVDREPKQGTAAECKCEPPTKAENSPACEPCEPEPGLRHLTITKDGKTVFDGGIFGWVWTDSGHLQWADGWGTYRLDRRGVSYTISPHKGLAREVRP